MKIQLPRFLREDVNPKLQEKFRASVDLGGTKPKNKRFYIGEHSWYSRCLSFEKMYIQYPLIRQGILTVAGIVNSQGVFTKPAVNRSDETYKLAEEACYRVDQLHKEAFINSKFHQTTFRAALFGSCFWEITEDPKFAFRLIPNQECIEPAAVSDIGEVTEWRQVIGGQEVARWSKEDIVHYAWNPTSTSWPYGTPLIVGLDVETEALLGLEENAKDYMEKEAWPYEILALGDAQNNIGSSDYESAKSAWKNRQPGQGITARNIPITLLKGGTGESPLREIADLVVGMKDNVVDGTMVPPISKLYNSTEASAKVMTQHIMTVLGQPLQWLLKEQYVVNVLRRYVMGLGFSVKSTPDILFESPDNAKKEEGEFWVSLVNAKIQSPQQACEHLQLEYDEEYWRGEEEKQRQQFEQQMKAKNEQQQQEPKKQEQEPQVVSGKMGESYLVTKVKNHD